MCVCVCVYAFDARNCASTCRSARAVPAVPARTSSRARARALARSNTGEAFLYCLLGEVSVRARLRARARAYVRACVRACKCACECECGRASPGGRRPAAACEPYDGQTMP